MNYHNYCYGLGYTNCSDMINTIKRDTSMIDMMEKYMVKDPKNRRKPKDVKCYNKFSIANAKEWKQKMMEKAMKTYGYKPTS